jgi:predicted hydrolase (HD superfamily)
MSLLLGRKEFGNPAHAGNVLSKNDADTLFTDWVKNPRLQLHMRQVANLMRCWAAEMAGLLHDADWDQWPELHCKKIIEYLEEKQVDPEILHAIASHGPAHFGVEPNSNMGKMLFAFDELSGLIHAYSLMRPGGYDGMDVKGVKKRLKEKTFAAGVSREEIADACRRAEVDLESHIAFIIEKQSAVSSLS